MERGHKITKCANCDTDLRRSNWEMNRSKRHYCNRQCMMEHRKKIKFYEGSNNKNWKGGLVEVICVVCGKKLERKQCLVDKFDKFFCSPECRGKYITTEMSGKNSWAWQGGKTKLTTAIRNIEKYRHWVLGVFKQDNYKCSVCSSGNIQAHHIKPVSKILDDNNISTLKEAKECSELWDVSNGITLCKDCHIEFHNKYGRKECTLENIIEFKEEIA